MRKIAVFADVSNLYKCIAKKFGKKLDYKSFLDFVGELGQIQQAIAYGAQLEHEAASFIKALEAIGWQTKYKVVKIFQHDNKVYHKADWDVGITIDMVNLVGKVDMVILGSADGDLMPAVQWVRARSVDVVVLACGISRDLKDTATRWIEIPESLLEKIDEAAKTDGQS